jgi:hypothetical protein
MRSDNQAEHAHGLHPRIDCCQVQNSHDAKPLGNNVVIYKPRSLNGDKGEISRITPQEALDNCMIPEYRGLGRGREGESGRDVR